MVLQIYCDKYMVLMVLSSVSVDLHIESLTLHFYSVLLQILNFNHFDFVFVSVNCLSVGKPHTCCICTYRIVPNCRALRVSRTVSLKPAIFHDLLSIFAYFA